MRTVTGSFDKGRSNPDDPAEGCSNTSAGGALDIATRGDWNGPWSKDFGSYSVERILGEAHPFTGPDYYSFWVNNRSATAGAATARQREPATRPASRWSCKSHPFPRGLRACGRREVSWLPGLPFAPSRSVFGPVACFSRAKGFPGDSGGSAPDSHRLPCPPTLVRVILYGA